MVFRCITIGEENVLLCSDDSLVAEIFAFETRWSMHFLTSFIFVLVTKRYNHFGLMTNYKMYGIFFVAFVYIYFEL